MKKIMLTLLIFSTITMTHAQLSGVYVADFKKKVEYYIRFFNDSVYYMDIVGRLTNDILDKRTMSIGRYTIEGNVVNLKDKVHNFQMKLVILNDSLKMEKSFCFMKDKTFGFKSSYVDTYTLNALKVCDSVSLNQDRHKYEIKNQQFYSLVYANYLSRKSGLRFFRYCLTINQDNTYRLYLGDILISEGNWEREGVELILYDKSLLHRFYLMIGDRVLVSKLLPGDYESSVLEWHK